MLKNENSGCYTLFCLFYPWHELFLMSARVLSCHVAFAVLSVFVPF